MNDNLWVFKWVSTQQELWDLLTSVWHECSQVVVQFLIIELYWPKMISASSKNNGFFFRENPLDLNSMSTKQHWLNELLGFQTLNLSITSKPSTLTHLNLNIYKGSNPILFCINYIHTFIFPVKSAIPVQFWSIQSEFYDPSSTFSFSNILPLIAKLQSVQWSIAKGFYLLLYSTALRTLLRSSITNA